MSGSSLRCVASVASALCAIVLGGCPLPLQTDSFPPTTVLTRTADNDNNSGDIPCDVSLQSGGTGSNLLPPDPGVFVVGFDFIYAAGANPAPCNIWNDTAFRGAAKWDMSTIPNKFLIATLALKVVQTSPQDTVGPQLPLANFITGVFEADPSWWVPFAPTSVVNGVTTGVIDGNLAAVGPVILGLPAPVNWSVHDQTLRIDITDMVRGWKAGTRPNNGIAIVGTNENLPGSSQGTTGELQSWLKIKATLEIFHNPNVP